MYQKIFFALLFLANSAISQNIFQGVVVDKETLNSIEFVDVYNQENNTSTNKDGRFIFTSKIDSIKFSLLGYSSFETNFNDIKSDTIFLIQNIVELDEIILTTNDHYLFKNIRDNISNNYPSKPYREKFFLRGVLKRNDTIVRIEDFIGLVERKVLLTTKEVPKPKKNYTIELQNLRKAGIVEKDVYFKQISFEKLFNIFASIGLQKKYFIFKEINLLDSTFVKLEFKPKKDEKLSTHGYYIINKENFAIAEFYLINKNGLPLIKKRHIKYTTVLYEVRIKFKKDKKLKKYYVHKAKLNSRVEIQLKDSEKEYYDVSYQYFTKNNFGDFGVKKNISISKDLFKIHYQYDAKFWNNQNELLLTKEMEGFLNTLDNKNNEFKVKSNID
ncbi:MAG: hypothetical protein L3J08_06845 [Flavobacteriaceae bacterium]|nr:hypothetical protein [Flavobacteriaceae bacterium]